MQSKPRVKPGSREAGSFLPVLREESGRRRGGPPTPSRSRHAIQVAVSKALAEALALCRLLLLRPKLKPARFGHRRTVVHRTEQRQDKRTGRKGDKSGGTETREGPGLSARDGPPAAARCPETRWGGAAVCPGPRLHGGKGKDNRTIPVLF